jgi:hypothetical protein
MDWCESSLATSNTSRNNCWIRSPEKAITLSNQKWRPIAGWGPLISILVPIQLLTMRVEAYPNCQNQLRRRRMPIRSLGNNCHHKPWDASWITWICTDHSWCCWQRQNLDISCAQWYGFVNDLSQWSARKIQALQLPRHSSNFASFLALGFLRHMELKNICYLISYCHSIRYEFSSLSSFAFVSQSLKTRELRTLCLQGERNRILNGYENVIGINIAESRT